MCILAQRLHAIISFSWCGESIKSAMDFKFEIWRLQASGDARGLIDKLRSPDIEVRLRAATALRTLGATVAIPTLQAALASEGDPTMRLVLISALDVLFDDTSDTPNTSENLNQMVELIALLNSDDAAEAIRAARALGDIRERLAVEALIVVFNNKKLGPRVRLAVAEALIKLESAPTEVTLLAALRHEKWTIRRSAAAVIGQAQLDWAVDPLIQALKDEHEAVRRTARAALERIDTAEAKEAVQAYDHPTPSILSGGIPATPTPDSPMKLSELPAVTEEDTQPTAPITLPDDVC